MLMLENIFHMILLFNSMNTFIIAYTPLDASILFALPLPAETHLFSLCSLFTSFYGNGHIYRASKWVINDIAIK